jgi:hypothetical protein
MFRIVIVLVTILAPVMVVQKKNVIILFTDSKQVANLTLGNENNRIGRAEVQPIRLDLIVSSSTRIRNIINAIKFQLETISEYSTSETRMYIGGQ